MIHLCFGKDLLNEVVRSAWSVLLQKFFSVSQQRQHHRKEHSLVSTMTETCDQFLIDLCHSLLGGKLNSSDCRSRLGAENSEELISCQQFLKQHGADGLDAVIEQIKLDVSSLEV